MYSLLKVMHFGLGCNEAEKMLEHELVPFDIDATNTVASKEEVDACFICRSPVAEIDAKSLRYSNQTNTNGSEIMMCGDWKWTTDERNRSGWQSNQFNSLIRFRLKLSKRPYISLTYMRSHASFGALRLSFRAVSTEDEKPLLGCNDKLAEQSLPYHDFSADRPEFSLWDTLVFPAELPAGDINTHAAWNLFNETVLSKGNVEYIDLYVENPNAHEPKSRIKIQVVTSC
jgi:hypothetical protein